MEIWQSSPIEESSRSERKLAERRSSPPNLFFLFSLNAFTSSRALEKETTATEAKRDLIKVYELVY